MLRAMSLIAAVLLLAGCATSPSYRYYGERSYADGYAERVVEHAPSGYGGGWSEPIWYDYPAYYSVFWSINRWYVDPFWNPHFYYGVTWFPRNYYSSLYRSWYGPSWYGRWRINLAYSPYRYAWVDHYYDWYPWYVTHPHYPRYYAPRYGNARNEAERLSRYSDVFRGDGLPANEARRLSQFSRAARSQALVEARREAWRGADYTGVGSRGRIDPGVSGFRQGDSRGGVPTRGEAGSAVRQDPQVSGFRGPDYGDRGTSRALPPRSAPGSAPREREQGIAYPYRSASPAGRAPSGRESAGGVRLPSTAATVDRNAGEAPRLRGEPASETRAWRDAAEVPRARPNPAVSGYPTEGAVRRPAPTYRAAPSETPRYESPRYEAPARPVQRSEPVVREAPRYAAPVREAPRYEAPAREAPRYSAPVREAPRVEPRSAPAPRERPEPVQRGESQGGRRPTRDED